MIIIIIVIVEWWCVLLAWCVAEVVRSQKPAERIFGTVLGDDRTQH